MDPAQSTRPLVERPGPEQRSMPLRSDMQANNANWAACLLKTKRTGPRQEGPTIHPTSGHAHSAIQTAGQPPMTRTRAPGTPRLDRGARKGRDPVWTSSSITSTHQVAAIRLARRGHAASAQWGLPGSGGCTPTLTYLRVRADSGTGMTWPTVSPDGQAGPPPSHHRCSSAARSCKKTS